MTLDYQRTWEVLNELEMVTSKVCSAREILESALNALENHKYNKAEALMYAADEFLQYYLAEFDEKFKTAWSETVVKLNKDQYCYLANDILTQDRVSNFFGEQYTEEEMNAMCDKAEQDQIKFNLSDYNTSFDSTKYPGFGHTEDVIDFCGIRNTTDYCNNSWNDFWEENYYPEEYYKSVTPSATQRDMDKVVKWRLPVDKIENGDTGEQEYFITFPDDLLQAANLNPGDEVEWYDQGDGSFILKKLPKTYDEMIANGWSMTADGFWIKE
jgi:hypothetical protein